MILLLSHLGWAWPDGSSGLDWAHSCLCGQMLFDGGLTGLR